MKQNDLASQARISERLLREIEKRNKPVPATIITAIATLLGATSADITLSTSDETPNPFATLLRLRTVRSTAELNNLASSAHRYEWDLKVDPSEATAEDMRQVMAILRRLVEGKRHELDYDEFDGVDFSTIPRLARLQELLQKLRANGVGVLAGSYVKQCKGAEFGTEVMIRVHFVPSEVDEQVIRLARPPSPGAGKRDQPRNRRMQRMRIILLGEQFQAKSGVPRWPLQFRYHVGGIFAPSQLSPIFRRSLLPSLDASNQPLYQ